MLELSLLCDHGYDITSKRQLFTQDLLAQGINQSDVVTEEMWFLKNLNNEHPLQCVYATCGESVLDGFLTPVTNKSKAANVTVDLLIDEVIEMIKNYHLRIWEREEYLMRMKQYQSELMELPIQQIECSHVNVQILKQTLNCKGYSICVNNAEVVDGCKFIIQIPEHGFVINCIRNSDNRIVATQYTALLDIIACYRPIQLTQRQNVLQMDYQFFEPHNSLITIQYSLEIGINQKLIMALHNHYTDMIAKLQATVEECQRQIELLLRPFITLGYNRTTGIYTLASERYKCCSVF